MSRIRREDQICTRSKIKHNRILGNNIFQLSMTPKSIILIPDSKSSYKQATQSMSWVNIDDDHRKTHFYDAYNDLIISDFLPHRTLKDFITAHPEISSHCFDTEVWVQSYPALKIALEIIESRTLKELSIRLDIMKMKMKSAEVEMAWATRKQAK